MIKLGDRVEHFKCNVVDLDNDLVCKRRDFVNDENNLAQQRNYVFEVNARGKNVLILDQIFDGFQHLKDVLALFTELSGLRLIKLSFKQWLLQVFNVLL